MSKWKNNFFTFHKQNVFLFVVVVVFSEVILNKLSLHFLIQNFQSFIRAANNSSIKTILLIVFYLFYLL